MRGFLLSLSAKSARAKKQSMIDKIVFLFRLKYLLTSPNFSAKCADGGGGAIGASGGGAGALDWRLTPNRPKLDKTRRAKSLEGKMGLMCNPKNLKQVNKNHITA